MRNALLLLAGWLLVAVSCDRQAEVRTAGAASAQEVSGVSEPVLREASVMRGVVVSCYRWGPGEWDGPAMEPLLDELGQLGVNAIQIHPYAGIDRDGGVAYRPGPVTPATVKPIEWANERGMATLLKPHLAYWGSGFDWRGEIAFDTEAQWQRFFREYEAFIVHQAELAEQTGAQVFAVGTELQKTLHREDEWRHLIAAVREVYSGKLTYAANWDQTGNVPFWDALDMIGVQFYFPLSEAMPPSDDDLRAGMRKWLSRLREFSAELGKPVMLTELGYAQSEEAALQPWLDARVGDRAAGAALKLRCMKIALEEVAAEPAVSGVFLWKWFPGDRDHSDEFVLQYDAMREVIRNAWGSDDVAMRRGGAVLGGAHP
ncbi:glycoside hydrolase family 113 [Algisphaera agarilytica]|uniref:Uncharacterized protein n=1 Tax=Algisphaera agarilytica TaxID=1385975 RepID=A0A7X0LK07_9BACT|nr:hypothetical protein [Algisphaera agarilytica]MBB6429329.1 hypothetical protein [Algisphaera agarilytica]